MPTSHRSNDVFLLHTPNDLFVWVGRGSTLNEKKEATTRSVQYLTEVSCLSKLHRCVVTTIDTPSRTLM